MFRRLAHNTAISAVAFFVISVVGLLLTPVLVAAYGLAGLGLVALARLLLPTGVLALIDFGISEVAVQATARARETGNWTHASGQLTLLALGSLVIGILAGGIVALLHRIIPVIVNAPVAYADPFAGVVLVTGLALPIVFLSLSAEGVLKGYERYGVVRGLEVISTCFYAGGVLIGVGMGQPFEWACYAYLFAQTGRATAAVALAGWTLTRDKVRLHSWTKADRREVTSRCAQLGYGRILGSLQGQAPPLFVAMLWGASAVGVYDVLTRLPRVAKSILGLINSTLLPVAVRLDASENTAHIRKLGETGLLVILLVTLPVCAACMLFSREILQFWIGPSVRDGWPWQSLMFLLPATSAIVGFGSNALLGRQDIVKKLNLVTTIQVGVQLAVSFGTTAVFQDKSFILGHVVALMVGFPWSLAIIKSAQGLSSRPYRWLLTGPLVLAILGFGWAAVGPRPQSILELLIFGGGWTLTATGLLLLFLPNRSERSLLIRIAGMFWPFAKSAVPR